MTTARTSAAVGRLRTRSTSRSVSLGVIWRTVALTSGIDTALIDSSRMPRPNSTGAIIGSPAISPHTVHGMFAAFAAFATSPISRISDGCSGS